MVFELEVYSRHWRESKIFNVEKTATGWEIIPPLRTTTENCNCDKKGHPLLYERLNHESINYPQYLEKYMEHLWKQATEENMTQEEIQAHLNELGTWISKVEKATPSGVFWSSCD